MTELAPLLVARGIKKAAIIDDAFDLVPRPDDLLDASWSVAFDDMTQPDEAVLKEIYPRYEVVGREVRSSEDFVRAVWTDRDRLSKSLRETLFQDFETTNASELAWLGKLKSNLEAFGLECTTMGRDTKSDIAGIDLVFVDLFLGFSQGEKDVESAINRAHDFVEKRADCPPLIVLMSRSPRLWEKRNQFRDQAGLLGSTFRVTSKADLDKPTALERLLVRLAGHYEDAKRVAAFVNAWDMELDAARKRFIGLLRCLDLPDLAQIRTLLLEFEGQSLGEYLLDVADRVLQHEIEADEKTITAAQKLNQIDLTRYPAPHLTGTPSLQDLVYRMLFQNPERLRLSAEPQTTRIDFGDLFQCFDVTGTATDQVVLVTTPACDLIRKGACDVLVLPGTLTRLGASDWAYGSTARKTSIFAHGGVKYWIGWNLKGRKTVAAVDLRDNTKFSHIGRLREVPAIELQQQLLVDMGRIGQLANPPATFPVAVSLFAVSPESTMRAIEVPRLAGAVCFVGRDEGSARLDHLVLAEDACDALYDAVEALIPDSVHVFARPALTAMRADLEFFNQFEKGLIQVPHKNGKMKALAGENNTTYLYLVRNEGANAGDAVQGSQRNAPLIMKVSDLPQA